MFSVEDEETTPLENHYSNQIVLPIKEQDDDSIYKKNNLTRNN